MGIRFTVGKDLMEMKLAELKEELKARRDLVSTKRDRCRVPWNIEFDHSPRIGCARWVNLPRFWVRVATAQGR